MELKLFASSSMESKLIYFFQLFLVRNQTKDNYKESANGKSVA